MTTQFDSSARKIRAAIALAAVLLLPACLAESTASNQDAARPFAFGSRTLVATSIVPDRVTAKGPRGYCVDKRSVKTGRASGFAMLAPCAALGGKPTGSEEPVLLTIQAQPKGLQAASTTAAGLAEAFAGHGTVHKETGDGLSLVQLQSGGDAIVPNGEPKHWRATLAFNGYLVGLAVYSEKGGAAANKRGKALLLAFAEEVLEASPLYSADPALAQAQTTTKPKNAKLFAIVD
ncbi:hypothetical protein KO498_07200 [Lentibacter algarum]|uniref:hypothetical protein n=1 Tax=Lentibacter algarum TaxID=576131 RepID=UPI001C06A64D|nr:hypothetical protein [Lentibacter algarum]MBU2981600.1 hypothetical protein [Lentibacter algarum]